MKRSVLVLMLAACGGGGESKPALTNTAPVSTAPVKLSRGQVLATLTALRDRACACTDEACGTSVKKEFDSWTDHPVPLTDPELDAVLVDYTACDDSRVDTMFVIDRIAQFKDLMCACKDKECAIKVNDYYAAWGTKVSQMMMSRSKLAPPSQEAAKKMTAVALAYGECMVEVMKPSEAPAP